MVSLTEAAYYSRQAIKYGLTGLAAFLILRWVLLAGIAYWRKLHPPPPPPPTVSFGKLPPIEFPESEWVGLSYRLETVTGGTPDLGDRATVYFMPVQKANLLALERMKRQVEKLAFTGEPEYLSEVRYRWSRLEPLPATLEANIISGSFVVDVSWEIDSTILTSKNLPTETEAIAEAKDFLRNAGLLREDLANGESRVFYLKSKLDSWIPAMSLSEADFVKVDLFRQSLGELPVLTADPEQGIVSVVFSGNLATGKRVVQLVYNYYPIDTGQSATYPIKSSDQAWKELQAGEGFVAQVEAEVEQVVVRKIYLAHYDSFVAQNYLQPIYVFEGDNNFVGYVPAISSEWIE
jgi:hypothetical protein